MLNSFWGKFGKQSNKCQVETFGSPAKFYQLLNNDELLILSVRVVNPEMLGVVNNHIQEAGAIQHQHQHLFCLLHDPSSPSHVNKAFPS